MIKGHDVAIFSPDGTQPKVELAFIKWEDDSISVKIDGHPLDIVTGLSMLIDSLCENLPRGLIEASIMASDLYEEDEDDES